MGSACFSWVQRSSDVPKINRSRYLKKNVYRFVEGFKLKRGFYCFYRLHNKDVVDVVISGISMSLYSSLISEVHILLQSFLLTQYSLRVLKNKLFSKQFYIYIYFESRQPRDCASWVVNNSRGHLVNFTIFCVTRLNFFWPCTAFCRL